MKWVVAALFMILADVSMVRAAEGDKVYLLEEGEDATSTHYYFLYCTGDSVQRVRWIWNGEAQNDPTVTEYVIKGGTVRVSHLKGERDQLADLLAGKEPSLKTVSSYVLGPEKGYDKEGQILAPAGKAEQALTAQQRVDLSNLLEILARERPAEAVVR
ncbi:hypothetical protein [Verrucomicrobium sp. BvORR034]|uniref:hypothetical protein n=1 Tax=Verrucomicrobium sp. BvORR034 TaxID=1396418 RepID=UPI000678FE49|nr:hypothetical protein [Verrucomicrobium sp. BvORR034]